jgi:hypothetical protein
MADPWEKWCVSGRIGGIFDHGKGYSWDILPK